MKEVTRTVTLSSFVQWCAARFMTFTRVCVFPRHLSNGTQRVTTMKATCFSCQIVERFMYKTVFIPKAFVYGLTYYAGK